MNASRIPQRRYKLTDHLGSEAGRPSCSAIALLRPDAYLFRGNLFPRWAHGARSDLSAFKQKCSRPRESRASRLAPRSKRRWRREGLKKRRAHQAPMWA